MTFDWKEYLEFAKEQIFPTSGELLNPAEEVILRIAISRAYYAAFCLSRNYLRDDLMDNVVIDAYNGDIKHLKMMKLSIHQYVINQLSADPDTRKISVKLGRLKERRVKADYRDNFDNIQLEYQTSISYANDIITKIDSLI
jgi:hypothetical protein